LKAWPNQWDCSGPSQILNTSTLKKAPKDRRAQEWNRLPSKGKSVLSFTDDRYRNEWLYDPSLLKLS
jgi:hypothetical protein